MENKLEFKHVAPYLPYSLMIQSPKGFKTRVMGGMSNDDKEVCIDAVVRLQYKPILKPLEVNVLTKDYTWNEWCFFFKQHLDVFELIPKGLAVDGSL